MSDAISVVRMARKAGERARDEQRHVGTPRMHGRRWHDHDEPHPLPPVDIRPDSSGLDALPEAEAAGEREGMTKRATAPGRASRRRARAVR